MYKSSRVMEKQIHGVPEIPYICYIIMSYISFSSRINPSRWISLEICELEEEFMRIPIKVLYKIGISKFILDLDLIFPRVHN